MTNLYLPDIPASPIYMGDDDKTMTVEWQEFFRSLFDRIGGTSAPTIIETGMASLSEIYNTKVSNKKEIDELEKKLLGTSQTIKSYDKEIDDLKKLQHSLPNNLANTLQESYNISSQPQIVVTSAKGGVQIKDAAIPIGADLIGIQNSGGSNLFAVDADSADFGVDLDPTSHNAIDMGSTTTRFKNINAVQLNAVEGDNGFTRGANSPGSVLGGRNIGPGFNTFQIGGGTYPPVAMFGNVFTYYANQTARMLHQSGGGFMVGSAFAWYGANDRAEIISDPYAFASFTGGYAYPSAGSSNSLTSIRNQASGAFIWAYPSCGGNGTTHEARIFPTGAGAVLMGSTSGVGTAYLHSTGAGSFTCGYINTSNATSTGRLRSLNSGAFAAGVVTANGAGLTAELTSSGGGSFANGAALGSSSIIAQGQGAFAQGRTSNTSYIYSGSRGTFAQGTTAGAGGISASGQGSFAQGRSTAGYVISTSGAGSFAQGDALTGSIIASGDSSVQFGIGTNSIDSTLQIGSGVRLRATGQVDHQLDNAGARFGAGTDAQIIWDGSVLVIDTSLVSPADLDIICGAEKTIELQNTVWDDLRVPLVRGSTGASNPPSLAQFKDNGAGSVGVFTWAFAYQAVVGNEEQMVLVAQLPHSYKEGTDIIAHIHWSPETAGAASEFVKWGLEYTWQDVNGTFGNTTIITSDASSSSSATTSGDNTLIVGKHYVTVLGTISGSGLGISSMLVCRLFRNSSHADDDLTEDAFAFEIDFHYEINTMGSRQGFIK